MGGIVRFTRHFKFLKQTKTIIPEQDVVTLFEDKMIGFYKKIKNNIFETNELIELRDWLLPMLMNGQVTVK
jgi:type I restriction enzyme S subunit